MKLLKSLAKLPKRWMVFGPLTARRARRHSFILMYHRVLPEKVCANANANNALTVSERHFDEHLTYLKKWFDIVPLTELVNEIGQLNATPSRPKLSITFDDGWRDNYLYAWPILKKHSVPATIFLVSDYVGTSKCLWWSALERHYVSHSTPPIPEWIGSLMSTATQNGFTEISSILQAAKLTQTATPDDVIQLFKNVEHAALEAFAQALQIGNKQANEPELFNWDNAREMQRFGIDFGAHTQRHELLDLIDDMSIQYTVRGSVEALREQGINSIPIFSYPNGNTDARVQRAVSKTGFKVAVGTKRGTISGSGVNPMDLPRINIGAGNKADVQLLRQRLARAFWVQR